MKIYTSYHARAEKLIALGIQPISISVQWPKYSKVRYPEMKNLAPTYKMLKMSEEQYDKHMNIILAGLDPRVVFQVINRNAQGKDVALLCYEADVNTCHRQKVGEWLSRRLNILVEEYELPIVESKAMKVKKLKRTQQTLKF